MDILLLIQYLITEVLQIEFSGMYKRTNLSLNFYAISSYKHNAWEDLYLFFLF